MAGYYEYMKYTKQIRHFLWPLSLFILLGLILLTTDPFNSPLPVVIVPFLVLFFALLVTVNTILKLLPAPHFSRQKRLLVSAGVAWLPVMLLILRSIDQLTGRDGIILLIFVAALLLYVSRISFSHR